VASFVHAFFFLVTIVALTPGAAPFIAGTRRDVFVVVRVPPATLINASSKVIVRTQEWHTLVAPPKLEACSAPCYAPPNRNASFFCGGGGCGEATNPSPPPREASCAEASELPWDAVETLAIALVQAAGALRWVAVAVLIVALLSWAIAANAWLFFLLIIALPVCYSLGGNFVVATLSAIFPALLYLIFAGCVIRRSCIVDEDDDVIMTHCRPQTLTGPLYRHFRGACPCPLPRFRALRTISQVALGVLLVITLVASALSLKANLLFAQAAAAKRGPLGGDTCVSFNSGAAGTGRWQFTLASLLIVFASGFCAGRLSEDEAVGYADADAAPVGYAASRDNEGEEAQPPPPLT